MKMNTTMALMTAASTVVVFLFFLFPVTDFDIWWHMAGGRFMVENWQFPYEDTFSYTAYGQPWQPNSWGFTTLSYLGYKLSGLDGINILKAIVSTIIFVAISGYLWWKKALNYFSLAFVVLALFSIHGGFSLRPHTFAYLLFVLFGILLLEYKKQRSYKIIAALAAIQLIWVNFHASFIFGLALPGIFILSEFTTELVRTKKLPPFKKDAVLMMSLLFASLLHVFYGYGYLIRIVSNYLSPEAQLPIREALGAGVESFASLNGLVILVGFIALGYFTYTKRRFHLLLTALFILALSINTSRFMRDLTIFLALAAPLALNEMRTSEFKRFKSLTFKIERVPSYTLPGVFVVFLLTLFFIARPGIGLGLSPFSYPVKAVEFIQENQLLEQSDGQLYNTYNFGGYLMWANQPHKVAMDGRARPYLGEPFARYWTNFEGGDVWLDSVERYRITVALMTLPHISGGTVYNQSARMFPPEEWALVYYDDTAMTYVRRIDALSDFIEQYEYKILDPQQMDFSYLQNYIDSQEKFGGTLAEINRGIALNESYRLYFTRAYVASLTGAQEQMVADLERTLEINPRFETAKTILKNLAPEI